MEFYKAIKIFLFLVQVSCTLGWPTTHFETKNDLVLNPWAYTTQEIGEYSQGLRQDNFPKLKANVDYTAWNIKNMEKKILNVCVSNHIFSNGFAGV